MPFEFDNCMTRRAQPARWRIVEVGCCGGGQKQTLWPERQDVGRLAKMGQRARRVGLAIAAAIDAGARRGDDRQDAVELLRIRFGPGAMRHVDQSCVDEIDRQLIALVGSDEGLLAIRLFGDHGVPDGLVARRPDAGESLPAAHGPDRELDARPSVDALAARLGALADRRPVARQPSGDRGRTRDQDDHREDGQRRCRQ